MMIDTDRLAAILARHCDQATIAGLLTGLASAQVSEDGEIGGAMLRDVVDACPDLIQNVPEVNNQFRDLEDIERCARVIDREYTADESHWTPAAIEAIRQAAFAMRTAEAALNTAALLAIPEADRKEDAERREVRFYEFFNGGRS